MQTRRWVEAKRGETKDKETKHKNGDAGRISLLRLTGITFCENLAANRILVFRRQGVSENQ